MCEMGYPLVIVREDMFEHMRPGIPNIQSYKIMAEKDSLYNTPPRITSYNVCYTKLLR